MGWWCDVKPLDSQVLMMYSARETKMLAVWWLVVGNECISLLPGG